MHPRRRLQHVVELRMLRQPRRIGAQERLDEFPLRQAHQAICCPVFAQSARNAARPLSVSGWLNNCRSTAGGTVQICAPIFAASTTCIGLRTDATSTSVLNAVVVAEYRHDIGDQPHAVLAHVVQPPDERADERRPRLRRQNRLSRREAQRHVHHRPIVGQPPARPQPVRRQRHLHRDVLGDAAQHARLGHHAVELGGCHLGAAPAPARWRRSPPARPGTSRPVLAISDGLVVTPSSSPLAASDLISAVSAVSTKNFMPSLPFAASDHIGCRSGTESELARHCPRAEARGQRAASVLPLPLREGAGGGGPSPTTIATSRPDRVPVLLPYPFPGPFDYRVPPDLHPEPGDVVLVPLNRREEIGVVWDHRLRRRRPRPQAEAAIRPDRHPPNAPRPPPVRRLGRQLHPVPARRGHGNGAAHRRPRHHRRQPPAGNAPPNRRRTPASPKPARKCWTPWPHAEPRATSDLARAAGVTSSVVRGMADAGLLLPAILPIDPTLRHPRPRPPRRNPRPRPASRRRRPPRRRRRRANSPSPCWTASPAPARPRSTWKPVAECLRQGRQALVLLPEIALSSQWLERFERRFGVAPAVWHSDLTSRIRRTTWRAVADGAAPVVVGARSALFLPFPDLGLVVIDEEHETAFKQEEGVVYHARDMAVVRARFCARPGGPGLRHPLPGDARQRRGRPLPPHHPADAPRRRLAALGRRHRHARHAAGARPLPRARR